VQRIARKDLALHQYKRVVGQRLNADRKVKRLQRSRQLLQRFPTSRSFRSVWFTDEKTFTVETLNNSQNDCVYAEANRKRMVPMTRLIRECSHFSRNVMVSIGVSRMCKTRAIFIEPGAKVLPYFVSSSITCLTVYCLLFSIVLAAPIVQ